MFRPSHLICTRDTIVCVFNGEASAVESSSSHLTGLKAVKYKCKTNWNKLNLFELSLWFEKSNDECVRKYMDATARKKSRMIDCNQIL